MKEALLKLLIITASILAPAKPMLIMSAVLILIDLITGILAARKQNIPITSAGLRRTIVKMFLYEFVIILGFLTQTYMVHDMPIVNIISSYIGLTEFLSCMENLNIIGGNKLLQAILDKLNSSNKQ